MKIFVKILGLVGLLILPQLSHAFELSTHRRIALQAMKELEICAPGSLTDLAQMNIWTSDLEEDINVVRKDLLFSHFYNPYFDLNMYRLRSDSRVHELQLLLQTFAGPTTLNSIGHTTFIGQIVHHLQDMAAPPHVVPVMHNWNDGFETYVVADDADVSSGLSCEQILGSRATPLEILKATAIQTLKNVADIQLPVKSTSQGSATDTVLSGDAFWKASGSAEFGQYGRLGNTYGQATVQAPDALYEIQDSANFYRDFKIKQIKLGVVATLQAFGWYLNLGQPGN